MPWCCRGKISQYPPRLMTRGGGNIGPRPFYLLWPADAEPLDLVLGVTALDLFVPRLNFVFGLAELQQNCAIISVARLDPRFYNQAPDLALLQERALKEAIHELGHLLGLPHCRDSRCIMFFSNTLADTDRKGPGFCRACRGKIQ